METFFLLLGIFQSVFLVVAFIVLTAIVLVLVIFVYMEIDRWRKRRQVIRNENRLALLAMQERQNRARREIERRQFFNDVQEIFNDFR